MTAHRPAIFLHIGAMKTGTTFVQGKLIANREALGLAGVLFPGQDWAQQVLAVHDALHLDRHDPRIREEARGAWHVLSNEMLGHRGISIVSVEFLSFAGCRHARGVVESLVDAGADVDVVLTVRDTSATIPSQWQTSVRDGSRISWPGFLRAVRSAGVVRARFGHHLPDLERGSFLQAAANIPRILNVWGRLVPRERLHVVTVPPSGSDPDLLWRRFAAAVGLGPSGCPADPAETNASLGFPSAELLRQVNRRLGRLPQTDYDRTVKNVLALALLTARAAQEGRAKLDDATQEFAVGWNRRVRDAIITSGAELVGNLDDLPVVVGGGPSEFRPAPEPGQVIEAAAVAVAAMDQLVRRRARRRQGRGEDLPLPPGEPLLGSSNRWDDAPDPVSAAAVEIARLCLVAIEHERHLRGAADLV
jgi:hypothetical protein